MTPRRITGGWPAPCPLGSAEESSPTGSTSPHQRDDSREMVSRIGFPQQEGAVDEAEAFLGGQTSEFTVHS